MKSNNYTGSSLIELLVICALCICIATLSLSTSRLWHRFAAQIELEHLYMACRYMQRRAMCTHQEQRLLFDTQKQAYRYAERTHILTSGTMFGTMPGIKGSPAQPTQGITNPISFKDNTIVFYPTGIISSGAVYITDRSKSCCYALSNAVSSISYLRRYRYHKEWHLMDEKIDKKNNIDTKK